MNEETIEKLEDVLDKMEEIEDNQRTITFSEWFDLKSYIRKLLKK